MAFRDRPIREKLTVISVVTSAMTLALAGIAFVAYETTNAREAIRQQVTTQAAIVGYNSGSAILFDDARSATATLAALTAEPRIVGAAVYKKGGERFAIYTGQAVSDPRLPGVSTATELETRLDGSSLLVTRPIFVEGERVGSVVMRADLSDVAGRVYGYAAIAGIVFLIAIAAAALIAWRAQRLITEPIMHLVDTARVVSDEKNYAVRADPAGGDEVGTLIRAFNEMLAQIQERDTELERARDEAEAGNRAKDEFLAVVSHELRTPLTPILSWTRLLATGELDQNAARKAIASIERNARSQAQLIDDLLDVSRIIAGKVRLELQPIDVAPVLEAAIDSARPAAEARDIRIEQHIDPRVGVVGADPERLQQVFWNLLSNAIKFTGRGGAVQVTLRRVDASIEVAVADTGQGIKPEFLPHVFDRFRQADSTSKRAHGGLGLGLAIVRHIVELHGGRVWAASPGEGHGSTFTVELPVALRPALKPRSTRAAPAAASTPTNLTGVRVLVVDDDPDTLDTLETVLEKSGAEVQTASSTAEALERLPQHRPDVLVSDIGMPGEDGYALIAKVRALPAEQGGRVPALALTAYARVDDRLRVLASGFQMHVPKPIEPAELVAVVASLADFSRQRPAAT